MSTVASATIHAVSASEPRALQAPYGGSISDSLSFQAAVHRAQAADAAPNETVVAMARSLDGIDDSMRVLAARAQSALERGASVQPSELILMSVRCYEFLFQCQLASNVANRTSDGLQQLFRQQS